MSIPITQVLNIPRGCDGQARSQVIGNELQEATVAPDTAAYLKELADAFTARGWEPQLALVVTNPRMPELVDTITCEPGDEGLWFVSLSGEHIASVDQPDVAAQYVVNTLDSVDQ